MLAVFLAGSRAVRYSPAVKSGVSQRQQASFLRSLPAACSTSPFAGRSCRFHPCLIIPVLSIKYAYSFNTGFFQTINWLHR